MKNKHKLFLLLYCLIVCTLPAFCAITGAANLPAQTSAPTPTQTPAQTQAAHVLAAQNAWTALPQADQAAIIASGAQTVFLAATTADQRTAIINAARSAAASSATTTKPVSALPSKMPIKTVSSTPSPPVSATINTPAPAVLPVAPPQAPVKTVTSSQQPVVKPVVAKPVASISVSPEVPVIASQQVVAQQPVGVETSSQIIDQSSPYALPQAQWSLPVDQETGTAKKDSEKLPTSSEPLPELTTAVLPAPSGEGLLAPPGAAPLSSEAVAQPTVDQPVASTETTSQGVSQPVSSTLPPPSWDVFVMPEKSN